MTEYDEEKMRERLIFFDYIYPQISQRIYDLESGQKFLNDKVIALQDERKHWFETIEQYKGKIQRIEQFLIKRGLIELLGNDKE